MTSRSDKPADAAKSGPEGPARKAEESGSIPGDDWSIDIDFDDEELFEDAPEPAASSARGVQTTQEIEVLEDLDEYEAIEIAPADVIVRKGGEPPDSGKPPPPLPDLEEGENASGPGLDPAFDETLPPHLTDSSEVPLLGGSAAEPRRVKRTVKLEIPGVELLGVGATTPRMPAMTPVAGRPQATAQDEEVTVPRRLPDVTDTVPDEVRLDLPLPDDSDAAEAVARLERELDLEVDVPDEPDDLGDSQSGPALAPPPPDRLPRTGTTAPYKTVGAVLSGPPVFDPGLLAPPRDPSSVDSTQQAMRPLSFASDSPSGEVAAVTDAKAATPAPVKPKQKASPVPLGPAEATVGAPSASIDDFDLPIDPENISDLPLPAPMVQTDRDDGASEPGSQPGGLDPNSQTNVGFQVLAEDESAPGSPPRGGPAKLPPLKLPFPPIKTQIGQRGAEASLQASLRAETQASRAGAEAPPAADPLAPKRIPAAPSPPRAVEVQPSPADSAFDFDVLEHDEGVSLTAELDAAMDGARFAPEPPSQPPATAAEGPPTRPATAAEGPPTRPATAAEGPPTRPVPRQLRPGPTQPRAGAPVPPSAKLFDEPLAAPPRPGVATTPPRAPSAAPPPPKVAPAAPPRAALPTTPRVPVPAAAPAAESSAPSSDFSDQQRRPTLPRMRPPSARPARSEVEAEHAVAPSPQKPAQPPPELPPPPRPQGGRQLAELALPGATPPSTPTVRELPPEASDLEDIEPLAGVRFLTESLTFEDDSDSAELELVPLEDYEPSFTFGEERLLAGLNQPVGLDSSDLPGIPRNPFEREGTPVISGGALPDEYFTEDGLPEIEPLRPLSEQHDAVEALSGEHTPLPPSALGPSTLVPALSDYLRTLLQARPGPGGPGAPETRAANAELGVPADVLLTARLSEYGGQTTDAVRVVSPSAPLARALVQGLVDWPERPTVVLGLTGSGKSHALNRLASALASRHLQLDDAGSAFDDELDPLWEEGALPLPIVIDAAEIATRSFSDGEAFLKALIEGHHLPAELINYRGPAVVLVDRVDVASSLGAHGFDPLYLLRTLVHARPAWRAAIATRPLSDAAFLNWGNLHGPFPVVEVAGMRAAQTRALVQGWAAVARPRPKDPSSLARLLPAEIGASPRLVQLLLGQWLTAATEVEAAAIRGGGSSLTRLVLDGVCTQTEVKLGTNNTRQDLQILADTLGGLGSTHLLLEDVQALLDEGYLRDDLDTLQSTGVIEVQVVRGDATVGGVTFTHPIFQEVLLAEYLEQEIIQLGMRGDLDRLVEELQPASQLAPYAISQVRRLIEVADLLVDSLASHLRPDLTESVGTWLWQQLNGDVFPESPHYPRLVSVAWIVVSRNNALDGSHDPAMEQLKKACGPTLVGLLEEAGEIPLGEAIEAL